MYDIERTDFGYDLTFGGRMDVEEMTKWKADSEDALADAPAEFGVFVDMRTLHVLDDETRSVMEAGQKLYKESGMVRSVVILDSPPTTLQFKRIAKDSGIYQWERYVDASSTENWRSVGLAWVEDGVDPDGAVDGRHRTVDYQGRSPLAADLEIQYETNGKRRRERWRAGDGIEPGDTYRTLQPVAAGSTIRIVRPGDDASPVATFEV